MTLDAATGAPPALLARPNIASKRWVYRQYDHRCSPTPSSGRAATPPSCASRGRDKGIAVSTDCNGRLCYLDPYTGGAIAVAEAARNVVCTGADPVAVTDCLNFGNPEKPEVYYHAASRPSTASPTPAGPSARPSSPATSASTTRRPAGQSTRRPSSACSASSTTFRRPSAPRSSGRLPGVPPRAGLEHRRRHSRRQRVPGSHAQHGRGPAPVDLDAEKRLQQLVLRAHAEGLLVDGPRLLRWRPRRGLAESSILGDQGFEGAADSPAGSTAALFGEAQGRIVVGVQANSETRLVDLALELGVPITMLGATTAGDAFVLGPISTHRKRTP